MAWDVMRWRMCSVGPLWLACYHDDRLHCGSIQRQGHLSLPRAPWFTERLARNNTPSYDVAVAAADRPKPPKPQKYLDVYIFRLAVAESGICNTGPLPKRIVLIVYRD